jgi:two-component system phosphate regulon sensor histidine kinase PhoR
VNLRTKLLVMAIATAAGAFIVADASLAFAAAEAGHLRRLLWIGAAFGLGLAFLLSSGVARRMSAALTELTGATRRMSEGDLAVRTRMPVRDELSELGQNLDRLAATMSVTLGDLRSAIDLHGRILDAMSEGVVVVDQEGRIVLVNPALRSMLLLGTDAVGKLLIETVRHAELHNLLLDAREASDEFSNLPVEIDLPGLKPRRVLVQAAPLSGDDHGMLFVFVDVTELRRLESLRRDFVANASHELRTPIAAVRSATETLRSGALDDPHAALRFLDIIERNAVRLQNLVEDMLELSKLEAKEFKLKRERVELDRVVPLVLSLFRERAEKKGVKLTAELGDVLPDVEADARAIEHVLSNLVDNAVKYCPTGSSIRVTAAEIAGRVELVVADTGPGIAQEHQARVFERFYRVDAGRSRELGGTGLGLSIVKHMVEAMRGKVSVASVVGKGSTFTVTLSPASATPAPVSVDADTGEPGGPDGGEGAKAHAS